MSNDFFLGAPFNISSYALLIHLVADVVGLDVGKLVYVGGDTHLYRNHLEPAKEQYERVPRKLPKLSIINSHDKLEDYTMDDLELIGYDPHPAIKAQVSVGL